MDARQIKDLALQWHQVELEEAAAERLAVMTAAFGDTLGARQRFTVRYGTRAFRPRPCRDGEAR